jgi:DivIVA domain-containing protein
MPLSPEDVRNKRFTTTRFRPGYDEDEVDSFLDQVEEELTRLLEENANLRTRPGAPPLPPPPPPDAAVAAPSPTPTGEPEVGQEAALKTLLLAQRTADEAIGEARKEAEQIVTDARGRAGALEQEAREKHAAAMSELERRRRELEREVEDLRAFEREYRTRLKAYLETQLRELEGRGVAVESGPAVGAPGSSSDALGEGATPRVSPFGPAPTFNRPPGPPAGPAPATPSRDADIVPEVEVDQGPETSPNPE